MYGLPMVFGVIVCVLIWLVLLALIGVAVHLFGPPVRGNRRYVPTRPAP